MSNKNGKLISQFTVKPSIVESPHDLAIDSGKVAVLKCRVDGSPKPNVKWMLNSNEIDANIDTRIRVEADGTLQIDRTETKDQGKSCVAGKIHHYYFMQFII